MSANCLGFSRRGPFTTPRQSATQNDYNGVEHADLKPLKLKEIGDPGHSPSLPASFNN